MGSRRRNLFVLAFVAGLVAASLWVISSKDTKLGLDLSGGTELIYQGRPTPQNPEVQPEDIDRAIEIIRDRTDSLGVAEPEINRIGTDSVRVGLPNVQNADRAIDQVGETAQLFFYDWEPNVIPNPNAPAGRGSESPFPRLYDAVELASQQEPECFEDQCTTTGPAFYLFDSQSRELIAGPEAAKEDLFVDQPGERQPEGSEILSVPQGTAVVREEPAADNPDTDEKENEETDNLGYYVIKDRPELSGDDIRNPEAGQDPTTNQPNVNFEFSDDGQDAFAEVTQRIAERGLANATPGISAQDASSVSGHFAVVLDNEIVSRPIINFVENPAGIDGRQGAQIEGIGALQESQELAEFLKIGALPIELKLISQSTVSASLGEQALDQGLKAGLIGLILVVLFLIAYYRFLGVVAALGLALYGIFFYALVELIPITLTLPGIAGLILTIGVAADSNVVIFERIKEEVRAGKSMRSAITAGYRHGIGTIIDANVIVLITAFILFVLSTAGVKGFAFTLGVGTIASLFTAVVFTQAFLGIFGNTRVMQSKAFLGTSDEERVRWHFDFAGMSKYFFSFSGVILMIGAIAFATLQLNLGLDFASGSRITAGLAENATVEDVRTTLEAAGVPDAEITEASSEELGDNVFQIEADIEPEQVREVQPGLEDEFGLVENGFDSTTVGPDLRRAGRPQRGLRDHLLAARHLRLHRVPVRAEVRGAGDHRRHPRHPHHGRRLLPERAGGDLGNRRRLPDDPRLFALRLRHRLRPNTRERAAPAAGHLLPDRQPLDERGADPIADHGPFERLPGRRADDLRRDDPAGLRLRDARRDRVRHLFVDLHRRARADRMEGARARIRPPPRADRGADGLRAAVPRGERDRAPRGRRCSRVEASGVWAGAEPAAPAPSRGEIPPAAPAAEPPARPRRPRNPSRRPSPSGPSRPRR